jgi:hypothetical protein
VTRFGRSLSSAYLGIRPDGASVAMTRERSKAPAVQEASAVGTISPCVPATR